jgi:hypothetical protein
VLLTGLAVGVAVAEPASPLERYRERYRQTAVIADDALAAVRRRAEPGSAIEVRSTDVLVFTAPAVVAHLEREGYHVIVGHDAARDVWGSHRTYGTPALLLLVTDDPAAAASVPGLGLVTTVDLLTPEQRRTYQRLPPPERCRVLGATGAESSSTPSERRGCRQRTELAPLDRHVGIWIGPPPP